MPFSQKKPEEDFLRLATRNNTKIAIAKETPNHRNDMLGKLTPTILMGTSKPSFWEMLFAFALINWGHKSGPQVQSMVRRAARLNMVETR